MTSSDPGTKAARKDMPAVDSGAGIANLDRAFARQRPHAERGGKLHQTFKEDPMETAVSIMVEDETIEAVHDAPLVRQEEGATASLKERLTRVRRRTPSAQRSVRYAGGGIPLVDDRMRLPSFTETCPHICDKIIALNGGRFNVDHYLRVLRAKAEIDASLAMALTAQPWGISNQRGQQTAGTAGAL